MRWIMLKKRLKSIGYKGVGRCFQKLPIVVDFRETLLNENPRDLIPIKSNYDSQNVFFLFRIPVEKITASRILKVWAEVVRKMQKESDNIPLYERDSFQLFNSFFSSYQPKTVAEHLDFLHYDLQAIQQDFFSQPPTYTVSPWMELSPKEVFAQRYKKMKREHRSYKDGRYRLSDGFRAFGPSSERLIKYEYSRLTSIYESLSSQGFIEEYGYPTAKLFVKDNEFMISPNHGWHRTAAMVALGYKEIPYQIRLDVGNIVRREDAQNWHNVKSGLYTEEQALELFDRLFIPLVSTIK